MFEATRRTLGLFRARLTFRRSPADVVQFTSVISTAKRALLIMPFVEEESIPTGLVISMLKRMYGDANLTVVLNSHLGNLGRSLPGCRFILINPGDLDALFLPRKYILRQVQDRSYDVAIDLNLDLVVASAYSCRASAARVRIGFAGSQADIFYNLQIKPDPTLSKKLIYDRLATCLQMF
jgi:ADP-heptose:LPS heptosyltransferase